MTSREHRGRAYGRSCESGVALCSALIARKESLLCVKRMNWIIYLFPYSQFKNRVLLGMDCLFCYKTLSSKLFGRNGLPEILGTPKDFTVIGNIYVKTHDTQ